MSEKNPKKRDHDGRYTYSGRLERMCVCGHTLGDHSVGSPADCLAHTMPDASETDKQCRCQKFRLSRRKAVNTTERKV